MHAVASGEVLLDKDVLQALVGRHAPPRPAVLGRLTPRETEVWQALARGLSNAEIAVEPCLGESTVKTHVARLLEKAGARDRVQLVVLAHTGGLPGAG